MLQLSLGATVVGRRFHTGLGVLIYQAGMMGASRNRAGG